MFSDRKMEIPQERIEKVLSFAEDRRKAENFYDENRASSSEIQTYERKLDNTLRELQERVKQQEEDLRKVRWQRFVNLLRNIFRTSRLMQYSFVPPMPMASPK